MPFIYAQVGDCGRWLCNPEGNELKELRPALNDVVDGVFLPQGTILNQAQRGNLGEFIAYFVGQLAGWTGDIRPFPANAFKPLRPISSTEMDLIWLVFAENSKDDYGILQEVKTSSEKALSVAYKIPGDYEKLYSTNPETSLKARLSTVKTILERQSKRSDLALRVNELLGDKPQTTTRFKLTPTLVYDSERSDVAIATNRMTTVRTTIAGYGWAPSQLDSWLVSVRSLDKLLTELACE